MYCGLCEEEVFELIVEGDLGADAIWCEKCYGNFELEDLPISGDLATELEIWSHQFGEWMDWENDKLYAKGSQLEATHNQAGEGLTEKVRITFGEKYVVRFSPSTSAQLYANNNSQ